MNNYYSLKIDVFGCSYSIYINGFPVFENKKGKGITATIGINAYIRNGVNSLQVMLIPIPEKEFLDHTTQCKLEVSVYPDGDPSSANMVANISANTFDINLATRTFEQKVDFECLVPFKDPLWFSSPDLSSIRDIGSMARSAMHQIRESLASKSIEEFMRLTYQREAEIASSMYIPLVEKTNETRKSIASDIFDSQLQISPSSEIDKASIKFYCRNQVVCLENIKSKSPLHFRNEQERTTTFYQVYFTMKPGSNELLAIR